MSQNYVTNTPPSTTSGPALASQIDARSDALLTMHSGAARPSYAKEGTLWLRNDVDPRLIYFYDGSTDVLIARVDSSGVPTLIDGTMARLNAGNIFTAQQKIRQSGEGGHLALEEVDSGKLGNLDMVAANNMMRIFHNMDGGGNSMFEFPGVNGTPGPNTVMRKKDTDGIIPAGTVVMSAVNVGLNGFLRCEGGAVSRTTYAALFAAIGGTYGVGDGSTTFNVPDMRGLFPRGFDNGRGLDSGRGFGNYQDDTFQNHFHNFLYFDQALQGGTGARTDQINLGPNSSRSDRVQWPISTGQHGAIRAGSETRGKNLSLLFLIKY